MPALNFQKRFAADVESGKKCQTIRAARKRPFKVGDRLFLYIGMRTKGCRKLKEAVCTGAKPVLLDRGLFVVDGEKCNDRQAAAEADGFDDYDHMCVWFEGNHGPLPFEGVLIEWGRP